MADAIHDVVDLLAWELMRDLRPAELPIFEPTRAAFWQAGGNLPRSRRAGGLEFGEAGQWATALTPVALAVGLFAVQALALAITEGAKLAGRDLYGRLKQSLVAKETSPIALSSEAYGRLKSSIAKEARAYLSDDHATALTEAILNRLARPG